MQTRAGSGTLVARRLLEMDRSYGWLARKSGADKSHLFRIGQGERAIGIKTAELIAPHLGVTVEELRP